MDMMVLVVDTQPKVMIHGDGIKNMPVGMVLPRKLKTLSESPSRNNHSMSAIKHMILR